MRTIVAIALIALVASSSASTLEMIEAREGPASGSFAAFQAFMAEFDRIYDSPSIMAERFAIFQANMADARESNIENPTAEYGITRFSDMTPEEWEAEFLTVFPDDSEREVNMDFVRVRPASSVLSAPPNSVDWTPQLNPIKDQKSCGSCWAFSAMSAVEGALVAAGKDNIDGSEQHLVDCAKDRSQGCRGGWMDDAIHYLAEHGIRGQEDYPYKAKDGKCQEDEKDVIAEISALRVNCANSPYVPKDIKTDDCTDDETRARTAIGVQSIAINAKAMMNYKKGILDVKEKKCKPKQLNHGVDIVGFDEEDGVPYYIIRNSWGSRWGMKGYMHIVANKNMCGIQAYQVEAEI